MNKKYILIFGILLVLPLIFAQTYRQNSLIDLKVPFEVNGSVASSSALCNVSINYPDGNYLRENASMTNRNNGDFNITLLASEINQLGEYEWRAFCCDSTNCAAGYGTFEVTESGMEKIGGGEGLTLVISMIVILSIAGFFFFISFKFEKLPGKVICISLASIIFLIAILFSLVILTRTFGGYSSLTEGYTTFWFVMRIIIGIVVTYSIIYVLFLVVKLWNIKRGFRDED